MSYLICNYLNRNREGSAKFYGTILIKKYCLSSWNTSCFAKCRIKKSARKQNSLSLKIQNGALVILYRSNNGWSRNFKYNK